MNNSDQNDRVDFNQLINELRESGKNRISFGPNPSKDESPLATMLREYAIYLLQNEGETIHEYESITVEFDWSEKDFGMDFMFWPKPSPFDPPDHVREEISKMAAAGVTTVTFPTIPPIEREPDYIVWLRKTAISKLTNAGINLTGYSNLQALFYDKQQQVGFYPLEDDSDDHLTQNNRYLH